MPRTRGLCFATRNLTLAAYGRRICLLLMRARARTSASLVTKPRGLWSSTAAASRHNERVGNRRTMRNGQNKRMRGRNNHRKSHNPMVRVYESNGPDVKIRGNPSHIAEKYIQLARDAQTSGDPIAAENYYQHAEHYYRVIAAAQEQFRQNNPDFPRDQNEMQGARDDGFDDGDEDGQSSMGAIGESAYGTRQPPTYIPRDTQAFPHPQPPHPQPQQPRAPQ